MIKIFIAGDVVPSVSQPKILESSKENIFAEIMPFIQSADIAIANLEAPVVVGAKENIKKSGPNLYTQEKTVEIMKGTGFDLLTLANNHFFDQGQKGVECTLHACVNHGIAYVGGGLNREEARRIYYKDIREKRIAIINSCEQEFSIANKEHGGSNPLDLIHMQEDITKARLEADYVVLIIHGGVEQYPYPTPRMKRWYRHFVDLGADAVINHHQHCVAGYEVYKGKPIFYGLGNFYFPQRDEAPNYESWSNGYAIMLTLDKNVGFDIIPYDQDIDGITLRDKETFCKEIELLSLPIADDYLLQQKFDEHIIESEYSIKEQLLPSFLRCRLFSGMARRGYLGKLYKRNQLLSLKNRFTCESHHEILQRLFTILTIEE